MVPLTVSAVRLPLTLLPCDCEDGLATHGLLRLRFTLVPSALLIISSYLRDCCICIQVCSSGPLSIQHVNAKVRYGESGPDEEEEGHRSSNKVLNKVMNSIRTLSVPHFSFVYVSRHLKTIHHSTVTAVLRSKH